MSGPVETSAPSKPRSKQKGVRLHPDMDARVARVGEALSKQPMVAAAMGGESTHAAALRYVIALGLPLAEQQLGIAKDPTETPPLGGRSTRDEEFDGDGDSDRDPFADADDEQS